VGILEGEGGGGAILPGLGAKVVVEAGASGHGLGVEVGREGAVLQDKFTRFRGVSGCCYADPAHRHSSSCSAGSPMVL